VDVQLYNFKRRRRSFAITNLLYKQLPVRALWRRGWRGQLGDSGRHVLLLPKGDSVRKKYVPFE
jgi:hypothetical protein